MHRDIRMPNENEFDPRFTALVENAVLNAPFKLFRIGQAHHTEELANATEQWQNILKIFRQGGNPEKLNIVHDVITKKHGHNEYYVGANNFSNIYTQDRTSYFQLLSFLTKKYTHRNSSEANIKDIVLKTAKHEFAHDDACSQLRRPTWFGVSLFRFMGSPLSLGNPRSVGIAPFHHIEGSVPFWTHVESLLAPNPPSESDYRKLGIVGSKYDISRLSRKEALSIVQQQIYEARGNRVG
jgi:hypothetical protein